MANGGMRLPTEHLYTPDGSAGRSDLPMREHPEEVFDWVLAKITEGDRINQADPAYKRGTELIADLMGDQNPGEKVATRVIMNQTKKAINTHASLLTDLRPLWEWRTANDHFKRHATITNDLLLTWWIQTFADMELADGVRYAETIGSSDLVLEWDSAFNGGDMRLIPRDWRDTLPISPERGQSIQDWEGVIYRESHSASRLRRLYPGRLEALSAPSGRFPDVFTKMKRIIHPERAPSTLSGLGSKDPNQPYQAVATQPELVLYRVFVRDPAINITDHRILMGPPGRNWSYFVEPGQPLYPRGRCILVCDGDPLRRPLFDGPNPYWHGMWPSARLSLQRWPWLMVGMPLAHDLRPLQGALNQTINDFLHVFAQWVRRGSVWGKNTPDSLWQRFDPNKPGWKVKLNTLVGTGFQLQDGPQLPSWSFEFLVFMFQKWDELSGTANLAQLLQLRQMPGRDTMDKFLEAMTPELRMEARQIERFLREIAVMFLPNVAQFYSRTRRMLKLGERGEVLSDLDYDPNTLIPAMQPGDPGYTEELDAGLPRDQRAMWFIKQFTFWVAPSSLLALHAMERKMLYTQGARQGYIDFWSWGEMLEIPNIGTPPPVLLPKTQYTPEEMAALPINPETGQPQLTMEVRVPETVTERLIAQSQLGIGQVASPAGRKASGKEPPQLKQKSDGRTTVSESG